MLRSTSPPQRPKSLGTGFRSLLLSLLFHALLALLLWCLVITVTTPVSIYLVGSTEGSKPANSVDVEMPEAELVLESKSESGDAAADANDAALDALIAEAMRADATSSARPSAPAQRSVEFFGTRAVGDQFVFVLDISYSMNAREGARFERACDELIRAVSQLRAGQRYYVFLFCWNFDAMFFDRELQYAEVVPGHERKLQHWIQDINLGAGTDPRRSLSLAHRMQPDAVFLLSDGEFNEPSTPMSETGWLDDQDQRVDMSVLEGVERIYRNTPIHTISFENPFTTAAMAEIAAATGGEFRYVKTPKLEPIDLERFLTLLQEVERKHRGDKDPIYEYQRRLSLARELISDGELLYAEYLIRPLYQATRSQILNPKLLDEVLDILNTELGETRLEDFLPPPGLPQWSGEESL